MFTVDNIAPTDIRRGGRTRSPMRIHVENMNPGEWLHTTIKANGANGKKNLNTVRRTVQTARKGTDMKFSVVVSGDHNIHVNRVK